MDIYELASYMLIVLAMVCCPGPMTLFSLSSAIQYGVRYTAAAILGSAVAYLIQIMLIGATLQYIAQNSAMILHVVKWIGVGYLFYLSYKQLKLKHSILDIQAKVRRIPLVKLMLSGFFVGLTNPKTIILFFSLIPQFIDISTAFTGQVMLMACVFIVLQVLSNFGYACFGHRLARWLSNRNQAMLLNRLAGFILLIAGIMLAIAHLN